MTKEYRRNLSDKESRVITDLSYKNKTIFTIDDLKGYVKDTKNFLHHLVERKWILKIRRGVYVITPLESGEKGSESYTLHSFVIGSLLTKPYYIGYLSALNYHGLTEKTPSSVYVATTKTKHSLKLLDIKFKFVTIHSRKMFGLEEKTIDDRKVMMSSLEKTIVDCLDRPEYSGGIEELTKSLFFSKNEINVETLVDYAKKIKNNTVIKRLGYISEIIEWDECLELLSNIKLKSGYSILEPKFPKGKTSKIKERWKLLVNAELDPKRFVPQ